MGHSINSPYTHEHFVRIRLTFLDWVVVYNGDRSPAYPTRRSNHV